VTGASAIAVWSVDGTHGSASDGALTGGTSRAATDGSTIAIASGSIATATVRS